MQQLQVLRHAKAVPWSPSSDDFPRQLSADGMQHAAKLAKWMTDELEPAQSILCSPSQRTRETLAPILSLQPELESATHFLPQLYHASATLIEQLLDASFSEADCVLVVGHNPGLEHLLSRVIHPRHYPDYPRLPTGTLGVVDFDSTWLERHDRGKLQNLVRGKHL